MSGHVVTLRPGTRLVFDGDMVEVAQMDGMSVTIRNGRTGRFEVLSLPRLVAGARSAAPPEPLSIESVGVTLAALTTEQAAEVAQRAAHVREVLSGDPGDNSGAVDGPLGKRLQAKATELGITARTLERWLAAYRRDGEAGLVDTRTIPGAAVVWTPVGMTRYVSCSPSGRARPRRPAPRCWPPSSSASMRPTASGWWRGHRERPRTDGWRS